MDNILGLLFPKRNFCLICGDDKKHNFLCEDCFSKFELIDGIKKVDIDVHFPLVYNNFLRETFHDYKFNGKNYYYKIFKDFLVNRFKDSYIDADIIVTIPMTRREEARRGFNQAEILGRSLAKDLEIKFFRKCPSKN